MDAKIVPMAERDYRMISLDEIRVLNTRNRDETQFADNVRSIEVVGLLKPIIVNRRHFDANGYYDLVCGEGRYLAYKRLNRTQIAAEVVDVDDKTALMYSLIENIARVPPGTMWFAYAMQEMHESGMTFRRISEIVGKDNNWVSDYIHLVAQGEERLIRGVEQGLFPASFAAQVARASDADVQHVLMDAFDAGVINTSNASRVRALVELRVNRGKEPHKRRNYSVIDLKKDITRLTKEKEGFVRQASDKERRMLILTSGMTTLWQDEAFVRLLADEGMGSRPDLQGDY
jgi:ParB family chromosome partitioning protein